MISIRARLNDLARRLPPPALPLVLIVLVVLTGNAMFVLRLADNNPIAWTAGISHDLCRVTCGRPMIDPNVGYITQSLGHQAALDLLHGHFPWWNYFEGLGQPLLGEMQSAAFFPLTLLFAMSSGLLWFHVSLEIIAGVSTYFLARRLSLPVMFATVAGMLFALNGTYAWLGNAVLNPVAFLPMLVLGVEMILESATSRTRRGWYVAALALALSIYAGFPEVAYFDGLFAGGWAIVRIFSLPVEQRVRALRRLGLGGVVGVVLALPVLVPFADFLKVGFIGSHTAAIDGVVHLQPPAAAMFIDPYVYSTIFGNRAVGQVWGQIGGYFGASVCVLALVGLAGKHQRALRTFLGIWIATGLLGAFNLVNFRKLWNLIPLVSTAAFPRYIMPSCEMAVVLLAALGLYDFATNPRATRLYTSAGVLMVALVGYATWHARVLNSDLTQSPTAHVIFLGLEALPFLALVFLLALGRFPKARVTPLLIALVVVGESVLLFFVPTAESAKQITVDYAPIHYLHQHQHEARFLDLAVLYPNWGTEFGLNSLSSIDLPYPQNYKNFIEDRLYPGLNPGNQFVVKGGADGVEAQERELIAHFHSYENASVKYLLMSDKVRIMPQLTALGVTKVFRDSLATVYEMPHPRSFFTASASTCTVFSDNLDAATVTCPNAGATLLRTELSMKGWTATVNGQPATITTVDGVYQSIALPAGASNVVYRFYPPHERYALLLGFLAGLFLVGTFVMERRVATPGRHRARHRTRTREFIAKIAPAPVSAPTAGDHLE